MRTNVLLRGFFAIVLASSALVVAGCNAQCDAACNHVNDMGCAACDCNKCSKAPAGCDPYLECVLSKESCTEMIACRPSPACANFVDNHCN